MTDINDVYKSPQANLATESGVETDLELAPRGKRLGAAILDGLISTLITIPLMLYLGVWEVAKQGGQMPFTTVLMLGGAGMIIFLLLHGYLLKNHGQTIGKRVMNIHIVDLNNNLPDFAKLISLRYVPMWIAALIPVVSSIVPLLDILFIFRKDKRCIHDLLAGTKVVSKSV